jgi:hypothetical protein
MRKDGRMDRYDKGNTGFSQFIFRMHLKIGDKNNNKTTNLFFVLLRKHYKTATLYIYIYLYIVFYASDIRAHMYSKVHKQCDKR